MSVLLYVGRRIVIVTFATSQDIAGAFMVTTKSLYLQLPDAEKKILKNNVKEFVVRCVDDNGLRRKTIQLNLGYHNCIKARPANVQCKCRVLCHVVIMWYRFHNPRQYILHPLVLPIVFPGMHTYTCTHPSTITTTTTSFVQPR